MIFHRELRREKCSKFNEIKKKEVSELSLYHTYGCNKKLLLKVIWH